MCRSKVLLIWSMVEVDEGERLASRCGGMVSKRTWKVLLVIRGCPGPERLEENQN